VRRPGNPETSADTHRFVWDLHYEKPVSVTHEYPITAVPGDTPRHPLGPMAVPGRYTVRLTAGGRSLTAPLMVKLDPRVKTSQAGLQQMFAMQKTLADLVERSSRAILQAKSLQEQAASLQERAAGLGPAGPLAEALKAFTAQVSVALEGPENPPAGAPKPIGLKSVNDDAYSVYGIVSQVDAAPTAAQQRAAAKIERDLEAAIGAWETILKAELPALNASLRQAGLRELDLALKPRNGENQGHEE